MHEIITLGIGMPELDPLIPISIYSSAEKPIFKATNMKKTAMTMARRMDNIVEITNFCLTLLKKFILYSLLYKLYLFFTSCQE
jgi:hypothetical protein